MELVAGACEGDCFFFLCASNCIQPLSFKLLTSIFYFSVAGHTEQKETDGEEEEDGKDECNYILRLRFQSFQMTSTL